MKRRVIAAVTTSRADYGLLRPTLEAIKADPALTLRLIATGSHLSPRFGSTVREIKLPVAARVPLLAADDSALASAKALGKGVDGFARAFSKLRPDLLLLLGDRFELLAAASAATVLGIPIAHLHGGESSEGVLDEQVRHAVSKLSHLHFTAAEPYRRRLIKMGEQPGRVFNFGAPGLEAIRRAPRLPKVELERRLRFSLDEPFVLVTCHPERSGAGAAAQAVLPAIKSLGLRAVLTYANADAGGRALNARFSQFARNSGGRCVAVPSLGQQAYFSLAARAAAVVGNSSSGIIEAPSLRVPTVNVGDRQAGRLRAPSVVDCAANPAAARAVLKKALSISFRKRCRGKSPYDGGDTSRRIVSILKKTPLGPALLRKRFHD